MELTITFFIKFILVVHFILALFFILLSLLHFNDDYNRYSISKSKFLYQVLYFKFLFVNSFRRIDREKQITIC